MKTGKMLSKTTGVTSKVKNCWWGNLQFLKASETWIKRWLKVCAILPQIFQVQLEEHQKIELQDLEEYLETLVEQSNALRC